MVFIVGLHGAKKTFTDFHVIYESLISFAGYFLQLNEKKSKPEYSLVHFDANIHADICASEYPT